VSSLIQGRIVYARKPVLDPFGFNPKPNRPFVVITKNEDIKGQRSVQCVAITDQLEIEPEDHYYLLPDGPARFKHGCSSGSAALCTWIIDLDIAELDWGTGCLIGKDLYKIIEKAKALKAAAPKEPSDPKPTS
jgi:hypothetical protein